MVTAQKIVDDIIELFEATYSNFGHKPELTLPYWVYQGLMDELQDKMIPSKHSCEISVVKYRGFYLTESPKIMG